MGKPRKQHRKKKYNYDKNRRRLWKKTKQLPKFTCIEIAKAYDDHKSLKKNMEEMGLALNPNQILHIPTAKELLQTKLEDITFHESRSTERPSKSHVATALEAEANIPQPRRLNLSEPEVRYCRYMMEKYGENYKAMARDPRNFYQDTPKQIAKKISTFKSIPEQYQEHLSTKGPQASLS